MTQRIPRCMRQRGILCVTDNPYRKNDKNEGIFRGKTGIILYKVTKMEKKENFTKNAIDEIKESYYDIDIR